MDKAEKRLYRLVSHYYFHQDKKNAMTSFLAKPNIDYLLTVSGEFLTG